MVSAVFRESGWREPYFVLFDKFCGVNTPTRNDLQAAEAVSLSRAGKRVTPLVLRNRRSPVPAHPWTGSVSLRATS